MLLELGIEAVWARAAGGRLAAAPPLLHPLGRQPRRCCSTPRAAPSRTASSAARSASRSAMAEELGRRAPDPRRAGARGSATAADGVDGRGRRDAVARRRAIVAVPPTLAGRIAYDPPLPRLPRPAHAAHADGHRDQVHGDLRRAVLARRGPVRPGRRATPGPVKLTFDNSPPDGSPGRAARLPRGPTGRASWRPPAGERAPRRRGRLLRAPVRSARRDSPSGYVERIWAEEEWTRGCYGCHMPTGAWTAYGRALREPIGPLHWAGAEYATVWNGYMDGAMRSGETSARRRWSGSSEEHHGLHERFRHTGSGSSTPTRSDGPLGSFLVARGFRTPRRRSGEARAASSTPRATAPSSPTCAATEPRDDRRGGAATGVGRARRRRRAPARRARRRGRPCSWATTGARRSSTGLPRAAPDRIRAICAVAIPHPAPAQAVTGVAVRRRGTSSPCACRPARWLARRPRFRLCRHPHEPLGPALVGSGARRHPARRRTLLRRPARARPPPSPTTATCRARRCRHLAQPALIVGGTNDIARPGAVPPIPRGVRRALRRPGRAWRSATRPHREAADLFEERLRSRCLGRPAV